MKIDTPLHAEHQLDQLAGQFAQWRQTRTQPSERIPEPLWHQAVALTPALSPSRVAKHLGLCVTDLNKQIAIRHGARECAQGYVAAKLENGLETGFVCDERHITIWTKVSK